MNMASSGYYSYYQPTTAPYCYSYSQQPARGGGGSCTSVHLFLFLATLFFFAAASLYERCESAVESLLDQLRLFLILSPLLLIVAVQLWAAASSQGGGLAYLLSQMAGDHRIREARYGRWDGGAGASSSPPWGVALVLVLVLFLVSYQSSFQDWRFPLRSR